jgi:trehalose 6-phosphate synthase/phosphatase
MNRTSGKLIVVSNAEPYKHVEGEDGNPSCKEVEGGLTTAMNPEMKETGGVWIAYGRGKKDFEVVNSEGKIQVPESAESSGEGYWLERLDFSEDQYENFYRGYANRVLWPICHSFPSKADLENETQYWKEGYLPSNKAYARAVLDNYEEGDTIWVHDYHLALVPRLIRNELPEAKIGVFWHIPWPPWENFLKIPHRTEILKGLAAADLIGLHVESYVDNLLDCAEKLGADLKEEGRFQLNGEETEVGAYPLGVDFDFFDRTDTNGREEAIKGKYDSETIVLGVDRQDYTKGIPERIRSFERFVEKNPKYRGEVSLIQRTPESRNGINEYQTEKDEINRGVSEFNGKFGRHDWEPITLFWEGIAQRDLIAEYRAADIGLVTPGLDGMNLVAKEFVAANRDPKVLILSEFAGASEQLEEAIAVNPYDPVEVADAIKRAIEMPEEEKRNRWSELREKVSNEDLPSWADDFLLDLDEAYEPFHYTRSLLGLGEKH